MCMCAQDGFGMSPRIKCHQDIDMYMGVEIVMIKMKVNIRRVMEESEVKLVKIREDMEDTRGILVKEDREDMRLDMRPEAGHEARHVRGQATVHKVIQEAGPEVGHRGHEAEQGGHGAEQGGHGAQRAQRLNTLSYL